MLIKQVSVFMENKFGKLANVIDILGKNDVDIKALTMADTTDFGILRVIVNDWEKAAKVLREEDMIVKVTDVIAVGIEDVPGGLSKVLNLLKDNGISVEYMYAFTGKDDIEHSSVVMKVDNKDLAIEVFFKNDIPSKSQL